MSVKTTCAEEAMQGTHASQMMIAQEAITAATATPMDFSGLCAFQLNLMGPYVDRTQSAKTI